MIRWCAGCHRYLGEVPPWNDYQVTHALCSGCKDAYLADDSEYIRRSREIGRFYGEMRRYAEDGRLESVDAVLQKGLALGMRPLDLMIGIVQPTLQEIGELWSQGTVTVALEHQFSAFSSALLALIHARCPELQQYRQSRSPCFLLVNAEGNYHTLGIQLVEMSLATRGVATFTVTPGLPAPEVMALISSLKPRHVGISVALATQMRSVREILALVRELEPEQRPRVLVGGGPVRMGLTLHPEFGAEMCSSLEDLDKHLR